MSYRIVKKFRFEAAHRLVGHQGKCRFLHGHSYQVYVTVESPTLDEMEMVADFADLQPLKTWIDLYLDHNTLLWEKDEEFIRVIHEDSVTRPPFVCKSNPTAEHIAKLIYDQAVNVVAEIRDDPRVESVTVFETETSSATYRPKV